MISWKVTRREARLIAKIAHRAVAMSLANDIDYSFQDAEMDITAAHANGCKLRLEELLNADEANFGHDVYGIRRYIDRQNGIVPGNLFFPRYGASDNVDETLEVPA